MTQFRASRARRRTLGAAVGVLALTGAAVSGCSGSSGGVEQPNLTVGVVSGMGATTFELGIAEHYFDQQGLNITVQQFPSDTAAEQALQKGTVDITLGDYSEFLNQNSPVANDVQVVGEAYNAGDDTIGLVAAQKSSAAAASETQTQLAQAIQSTTSYSVAVPDLTSPEYVALANWSIAEQASLPTTTPNIHAVGNGQDPTTTAEAEVAAVASGAADMAVLQEPYLTQAVESGKVIEVADLDVGNAQNMPISGYFSLSTFAQKNPRTIAAFTAGLSLSQELGLSRMEIETALEQSKVVPNVATTTAIGNFPTGIVPASLDNALSLMGNASLNTAGLNSTKLTSGAAVS